MHGEDNSNNFYKEFPKSCAPDDFWGQVRRTVNGEAISTDQIQLIVDAVVIGLKLNKEDKLLDLCCGNGALSHRIFNQCRGGLGVDYSQYLIEIAKKHFAYDPRFQYKLGDVVEYVEQAWQERSFNKAFCYGSAQYLGWQKTHDLLQGMRKNFPNLERFFIGNLPDRDRIADFFDGREYPSGIEDDSNSDLGRWWSRDEFSRISEQTGWHVSFRQMPASFYAAHYRFDAVLTPLPNLA